jgi:hypothetical protein
MISNKETLLTVELVGIFDKLISQMERLLTDMESLAKKSPDGAVSKFKLGVINEQLRTANQFLLHSFKPIDGFEEFDVISLPSNSDVVLVVSQYLACLERWRSNNVRQVAGAFPKYWVWDIVDKNLKTRMPSGTVDTSEDDL